MQCTAFGGMLFYVMVYTIAGFVLALLYNTMYLWYAYESPMEEDPRKEYTNEG
jgi:hypothetical protein